MCIISYGNQSNYKDYSKCSDSVDDGLGGLMTLILSAAVSKQSTKVQQGTMHTVAKENLSLAVRSGRVSASLWFLEFKSSLNIDTGTLLQGHEVAVGSL